MRRLFSKEEKSPDSKTESVPPRRQKHLNLIRSFQGEETEQRQTHHSDSQFLQNDPLKHRRVSSLSETPPLSLCTVQGRKRGMNECVLGTQHWQWLYTTPTTASIKNRKIKSRFRSVWDISFPRVPAHMLASLIHFNCHYMFRKDVQYIHFCLSKKQTA